MKKKLLIISLLFIFFVCIGSNIYLLTVLPELKEKAEKWDKFTRGFWDDWTYVDSLQIIIQATGELEDTLMIGGE